MLEREKKNTNETVKNFPEVYEADLERWVGKDEFLNIQ